MKIEIAQITNANVYLNGSSLLGRASEIDLPQIKHLTNSFDGLGLVGSPEFFAGIDKMEASFKWNSCYPDAMRSVANPVVAVALQVRSSMETYTGQGRSSQVAVVTHLAGVFKEFSLGTFKGRSPAEFPSTLAVHYIKQIVGGSEVVEIDVIGNIYRVGGSDILSTYRANIGG
jgi:P2 family phage contractile tail tube protein